MKQKVETTMKQDHSSSTVGEAGTELGALGCCSEEEDGAAPPLEGSSMLCKRGNELERWEIREV